MLYHYTSFGGFLGIIESGGVRATHSGFLNDSSELQRSLEFAKRVVGSIYMEDDYLGAFGYSTGRALYNLASGDTFLASFSEVPDQLSQWRGYCPNGVGLCLGFSQETLVEYCEKHRFRFEKCIYDQDDQVRRIGMLVDECIATFPKPSISREAYTARSLEGQCEAEIECYARVAGPEKEIADAAIALLTEKISELAPLFKHPGFLEEAEWRVIVRNPELGVKFRATQSFLAPYILLKFLEESGKDALRQVIVGPNPNQERCASSVKMLLSSFGNTTASVDLSLIPYVTW